MGLWRQTRRMRCAEGRVLLKTSVCEACSVEDRPAAVGEATTEVREATAEEAFVAASEEAGTCTEHGLIPKILNQNCDKL